MPSLISSIEVKYQGRRVRLSTRIRLSGPDLVIFLHGLGCAKDSFDAAFDVPSLGNHSLCSFDFPGHGGSARMEPDLYTLDSFAEITALLVRSLRRRLAVRQVHIVGHSMGGVVGLLASKEVEDLAGYVSVEGNLVSEDCGLVSRDTAGQDAEEFNPGGYERFLANLKTSQLPGLRAWSNWYGLADPFAVHTSARSLVEWSENGDLLKLFQCFAAKKLYLYGDDEDKSYLLKQLNEGDYLHLGGVGHFMMVEDPGSFYREIYGFLTAPTGRN
jgi:pimeloyl-ACP methyl ester carboxylesterase